ncbi:unnamed protein product, partial [Scytosiphon promiscuus]
MSTHGNIASLHPVQGTPRRQTFSFAGRVNVSIAPSSVALKNALLVTPAFVGDSTSNRQRCLCHEIEIFVSTKPQPGFSRSAAPSQVVPQITIFSVPNPDDYLARCLIPVVVLDGT